MSVASRGVTSMVASDRGDERIHLRNLSMAESSEANLVSGINCGPLQPRDVSKCNGHVSNVVQPRFCMAKPGVAADIKPEKRTSNQSLIDTLEARFVQLCEVDLKLDEKTQHDALLLFRETKSLLVASIGSLGSGTDEDMARLWSVCVIFCSLRLNCNTSSTAGVTLSQLLEITRLGIWDFFRELPQFLLKAESVLRALYGDARDRLRQVKEVQANFVHLTVLFNYYKHNFQVYFRLSQGTQVQSSSSSTNGAPTSSDHLRFGWMLFLALRMHVLSQFMDLVTCTNGLIAIFAIMVIHMPVHLRNFSLDDNETFAVRGSDGIDVIASLCNLYEASEEDVRALVDKANDMIKEILQIGHDPKSQSCGDQLGGIDTGGLTYFEGLMEDSTLTSYLKALDKDYEEKYYKRGDLDERMFLNEVNLITGAASDLAAVSGGTANFPCVKRKHGMLSSPLKTTATKASALSPPGSPCPSPMKTMSSKMPPPTPVTITMTTAKWLRTVIAPLSSEPSYDLLHFLKSCNTDITQEVTYRAHVLLEAVFQSEGPGSWGVVGGLQGTALMDTVWAEQRRLEALKLYYKVLSAMCRAESQRLSCNNLSALLTNERFHRCMLACSAELVLATHKTVSMNFPAVLEPTGITAFDLSKVIESFVRHEETLPRELKRHLNSIEEKLLEKLAWEKGSSMYNSLVVAKPHLQPEINRLNLLADPMPSLDTLCAQYRVSNGSIESPPLNTGSEVPSACPGECQSQSSPPRQVSTPSSDVAAGTSASTLVSPVRERSSAFSAFSLAKARMQPPLQSAFASPQRPSSAGGGETCAETVINVFFQKVLKLAAIRIKMLCESLKQPNHVMEEVYRMVQYVLHQETSLFFNRHIDQIILCSIYGVCKVKQLNLTFKEIIQRYKENPQSKSHVFRTVLLDHPTARPTGRGQDTGDIIKFYNDVFVPTTKGFLVQLNSRVASNTRRAEDGDLTEGQLPGSPGPSPFPSLPDMSPKKVSANQNVYVSPLRSSKMESLISPHSRSLYACVGESTHAYQSPSKDLTEINNRVNNRRLGRLHFGEADLVSDSLVARSLYPCNSTLNDNSMHLSSDSVLSQSQSLSWSNSTPPNPSPSKRPRLDR